MSLSSLLNLPSSGGFMSRVAGGVAPTPTLTSPPSSSGAPLQHPLGLVSPSTKQQQHTSVQQQQEHQHSPGRIRRYVCDHHSAPPAHQYITTDKTNILIRALTLKRSKEVLISAGRAAAGGGAGGGSSSAGGGANNKNSNIDRAGGGGGGASTAAASAVAAAATGSAGGGTSGGGGGGDPKSKRVAAEGGPTLGQHQKSGLERAAKRPALDPASASDSLRF